MAGWKHMFNVWEQWAIPKPEWRKGRKSDQDNIHSISTSSQSPFRLNHNDQAHKSLGSRTFGNVRSNTPLAAWKQRKGPIGKYWEDWLQQSLKSGFYWYGDLNGFRTNDVESIGFLTSFECWIANWWEPRNIYHGCVILCVLLRNMNTDERNKRAQMKVGLWSTNIKKKQIFYVHLPHLCDCPTCLATTFNAAKHTRRYSFTIYLCTNSCDLNLWSIFDCGIGENKQINLLDPQYEIDYGSPEFFPDNQSPSIHHKVHIPSVLQKRCGAGRMQCRSHESSSHGDLLDWIGLGWIGSHIDEITVDCKRR